MDIYREAILDHYKNPQNFGHLDAPDAKVEEGNAACGDRIVMEINVKRTAGSGLRITDVAFSGEGCAISQAAASMLTEKVKGMRVDDVMKLNGQDILALLGTTLTPSRMRCATLSVEVLHKAVTSLK